jgi:methionine aminopeptidase
MKMDSYAKEQIKAHKEKFTCESARERLQDSINTLQRAMYELERYAEKFNEAVDNLERAKVLNHSVNHLVCNIQPNLRIDLLADSQAELVKLEVSNA